MASKFDQPDSDDTSVYDEERPVDVQDEPTDGEPWLDSGGCGRSLLRNARPLQDAQHFRVNALLDAPIDPAEHAAHRIIDALSTLETELAKVSDLERCWSLRRIMGSVTKDTERVHQAIIDKIDVLSTALGK